MRLRRMPLAKVALLALLIVASRGSGPVVALDETTRLRLGEAYSKLALHFEVNQGQTDERVRVLSRGSRHALFLTPTDAVLVLRTPPPRSDDDIVSASQVSSIVLQVSFVGANPEPLVVGLDELPGKANYFIGQDRRKWRTDVPTYRRARYHELYPGIDLIYYYDGHGRLEYDLIVAPGANPDIVSFTVRGADRLELDAQGDLVLHTAPGPIRQRRPIIYQEVEGTRRPVPGGYVLKSQNQVAFEIGGYDRSRPLIIDPVLAYATYLGGNDVDEGVGIAVDVFGDAYVTGFTASADFPVTTGVLQSAQGSAFVTKLRRDGSELVYSTYLGGGCCNVPSGIAVDLAGNAYVVGHTSSEQFPTTTNAFQRDFGGGDFDAFVAKISPSGSQLLFASYLGGSGQELGLGVAVDLAGHAFVTGRTQSADFPITVGAFQPDFGGFLDAFVVKIARSGSALLYSSYLGGSGFEEGTGIAVDLLGRAYVTGRTDSIDDFPTTPTAVQPTYGGGFQDGFIAKVNHSGSKLRYSTYLGGSTDDISLGIAVDIIGNAYVTGLTSSTNFPTTLGAIQAKPPCPPPSELPLPPPSCLSAFDAFVTKLNRGGWRLVYSTYLGGTDSDTGLAIAVDQYGHAYVAGSTSSTNFPTTADALQGSLAGSVDAFIARLDRAGSRVSYSTYLGGSEVDVASGIALDLEGHAHVTGLTSSANFPTTVNALRPITLDPDLRNSSDAFVVKIRTGHADRLLEGEP